MREEHLKVYQEGRDGWDEGLWSGYLRDLIRDWEPGNLEREDLIAHVQRAVRDQLARGL